MVNPITDSSGNALDGAILAGFPTYAADVPNAQVPQTGATNNFSINYNGGDAVRFAYSFPFQTLANATMEFWFKPNATPGWDFIWGMTTPGDQNRFSVYWNPNQVCLNYREPSGPLHELGCSAVGTVPAAQWSYIALIKQGNAYSIYVKGPGTGNTTVLSSQVVDVAPNLPTTTEWTVNGRGVLNGAPSSQGGGLLDEIRLSNQVLNPSQFLVASPHPTNKDQCKNGGYVNFVDDSGQPFKNQGQCVSYVNHH